MFFRETLFLLLMTISAEGMYGQGSSHLVSNDSKYSSKIFLEMDDIVQESICAIENRDYNYMEYIRKNVEKILKKDVIEDADVVKMCDAVARVFSKSSGEVKPREDVLEIGKKYFLGYLEHCHIPKKSSGNSSKKDGFKASYICTF